MLSRLYEPEAFGTMASFTGLVVIVATLATGRYEIAIPLAKSRVDAANLLVLAATITIVFSALSLAVVALFRGQISTVLNTPDLADWLWLAPLALLATAWAEIGKYWVTRERAFGTLSLSNVGRSVVALMVQLAVGIRATAIAGGLITGQVVGAVLAPAVLLRGVGAGGLQSIWAAASRAEMRRLANEYAELPRRSFSVFLNRLSTVALPLVLAAQIDPVSAGLVMLSQRIVVLPVQVFGQAIWQVAHARLGPLDERDRRRFLRAVNQYSCALYGLPMVAVGMFAYLSSSLFGPEWGDLELIIPMVAFMTYINAVSNSVSYWAVSGMYREESRTNILLVVVRLGSVAAAGAFFGLVGVVGAYCAASSLLYLGVYVFWGRHLRMLRLFLAHLIAVPVVCLAMLTPVRVLAGDHLVAAGVGATLVGAAYLALMTRSMSRDDGLRAGGEINADW
ncbi:lipopolysaccharide biosynthesis protein [Actinospongicola halichondriae]|uniref:lipopolysaccharide biosynthesis protein n=1 Tax=Actinospongicola halichondriae TaxID=3236844 RepID=UPI003D43A930